MINWEAVGIIGAVVFSLLGFINTFRKGKSEIANYDSETFANYQKSLKESHDNYMRVMAELEELKQKLSDSECYIKALCNQLIMKGVRPLTLEQALKQKNNEEKGL